MKFLIAPDSFKHSLSARTAAAALAEGILRVFPDAEIVIVPLADGGEGTAQALIDATGGRIIKTKVNDPLMRSIDSFFGLLGDGKTAVIEMAAASGIELLDERARNPLNTNTYGTGELVKKALDLGCDKLIIGIGGSATNDGGAGMAKALGARFLDKNNKEFSPTGGNLSSLKTIDVSELDKRLKECEVTVAADVNNPLTGPTGAATVYAPQKGASDGDVKILDANLKHYACVISQQLGRDIENIPGAGAAGGLGAGLIVFARASIESGFHIVSRTVDLERYIKNADFVITGEGKIDDQTQFGKTPQGVADIAVKHGKPVIAFAGTLGERYKELYNTGFDVIFPIADKPMTLEESIKNTETLLQDAAERMARTIKTAKSGNARLQPGIARIEDAGLCSIVHRKRSP